MQDNSESYKQIFDEILKFLRPKRVGQNSMIPPSFATFLYSQCILVKYQHFTVIYLTASGYVMSLNV